jgi:RNA polymerase sigma-70 factor (ECF subfamily)
MATPHLSQTQPPILTESVDSRAGTESCESSNYWATVVARIQAHEEAASEELYQVINRGIRYFVARRLGYQDLDDKVHDIFETVLSAIHQGMLRDPARLMGFVRVIAQRQVFAAIEKAVHQRHGETDLEGVINIVSDQGVNPEEEAWRQERSKLMLRVLNEMPTRDREILIRFYLQEQTMEQICAEMGLTETQFRLTKSRAKARFGKLGQKELTRPTTLMARWNLRSKQATA